MRGAPLLVLLMLLVANARHVTESAPPPPPPSSSFPCRSNLPYDFRSIDRFTDNMCAQCLWYMAGSEAPWHRFEAVHQWHVVYNASDTVNVLLCAPDCRPFHYEDLKLASQTLNHTIGSELRSTYYLVSASPRPKPVFGR